MMLPFIRITIMLSFLLTCFFVVSTSSSGGGGCSYRNKVPGGIIPPSSPTTTRTVFPTFVHNHFSNHHYFLQKRPCGRSSGISSSSSSSNSRHVTFLETFHPMNHYRKNRKSSTNIHSYQIYNYKNYISMASSSSSSSSSSSVSTNTSTRSQQNQQQKGQKPRQQLKNVHVVDNITCVEVTIELPLIGPVTVLEATAQSQEDLVNMALLEDNDDDAEEEEQQRLNAGDPYGAVLWPASSAIARHLLTNYNLSSSNNNDTTTTTLLELGAGTGLISIASSLAGVQTVVATDYEQIPLQLLQYAAKYLNNNNNKHETDTTTTTINSFSSNNDNNDNKSNNNDNNNNTAIECLLFDVCSPDDPLPMTKADIVVVADILYEPVTAKHVARRTYEALQQGSKVLIGDSPGRAGRPTFLKELKETYGIHNAQFRDVIGKKLTGERHDLICGKDSTSISQQKDENLTIAIMELDPHIHLPS